MLALGLALVGTGCSVATQIAVDQATRIAEREAAERMEGLVTEGSDAAEDAVGGAIPGQAGTEQGGESHVAPRPVDPDYDFARGERPLFYEDYAADALGQSPTRIEVVNGTWEVVEVDEARWLRGTGGAGSGFQIVLQDSLPERFTIEYDVMYGHRNQVTVMATASLEPSAGTYDGPLVQVRGAASGISSPTVDREELTTVAPEGFPEGTPVEVAVDGGHVQVFVARIKVADVPDAGVVRSDRLYFEDPFFSTPEAPVFIGRIRVDGWEPGP